MQRPVLRKQKKQEEYSKHRVEDLWVKPLDLIELCNQGRFFFFIKGDLGQGFGKAFCLLSTHAFIILSHWGLHFLLKN